MEIVAIAFAALTMAYQVNKPCDDACFQKKIDNKTEFSRDLKPNDNSWRYEQTRPVPVQRQ